MPINTTAGPVEGGPGAGHVINTSRIVEEGLTYTDEPEAEIVSVLPAPGWCAVVGEQLVPLVAFAALDDGKMHGVVVGEDGKIDLVEGNVEDRAGFVRYEKTNEPKENQ